MVVVVVVVVVVVSSSTGGLQLPLKPCWYTVCNHKAVSVFFQQQQSLINQLVITVVLQWL